MAMGLATVSSRGQIVLPKEVRDGIKKGEQLLIIRRDDQWIMKRATADDKAFDADWKFAKRTEEALDRVKAGKSVQFDSVEEFLSASKKW